MKKTYTVDFYFTYARGFEIEAESAAEAEAQAAEMLKNGEVTIDESYLVDTEIYLPYADRANEEM